MHVWDLRCLNATYSRFIQINMAAFARSHKLFFTNNTLVIAKGKRELVTTTLPQKRKLCWPAIKASTNTEKHLKTLYSYLGKLHRHSNQPCPQSLSRRTESTPTTNQLKAEIRLKLVEDYLGKVKDAEQENHVSENILLQDKSANAMKDQVRGRVRPSYAYMEMKTDIAEDNQQFVDTTSDFYLIGALASMDIAVFLFEIASPVKNSSLDLFTLPLVYGAKINSLILTGQWWRLVTPIFLHSGIFHIALGIWVLFTFGIEVSQIYGSFTFLCIYVLGGISGNLISFLHTPEPTVGGTGPVFAVIGAWIIHQLQNKDVIAKDAASERMFHKAILATALSFVLSNFGPIDDWSHFAATFTGIAYGFVTCPTIVPVKDASSPKAVRPERITLNRQYADPWRSLVFFSLFLFMLSSLLFIIEPPIDLIE